MIHVRYFKPFRHLRAITVFSSALACIAPLMAFTQTETEELLETIDPELTVEESAQLEQIQWLQEHPFDLNEVTVESLSSIPGVAATDAARVVGYRSRNGPFLFREQLHDIPGLPPEAARWLEGFVVVKPTTEAKVEQVRVDLRARTLQDIQLRDGYKSRVYAGSPNKSYMRINAAFQDRGEAGILAEKDAGESSGAGFLSGFVKLENLPGLDNVLFGDFRFEAGQGLVFWQGAGFGKGGDPAESGRKSPRGVIPHRSTDEFHFLRGVGVGTGFTLNRMHVFFSGFYSSRNLPATIDTSGLVGSFYEPGLFRTESELSKRDGVRERLLGGSLLATIRKGFCLGASGYWHRFSHQFNPTSSAAVDGDNGAVGGLNGSFEAGFAEVSTELAAGTGASLSWLLRGILRTGRTGSLVVIYRVYSPDFPGLHAAGFGERADTRNERGLYLGLTFRPARDVAASLSVDNFSFPRRTATIPIPSNGHDVGLNLDARLSTNADVSVRSTWSRNPTMASDLDGAGREVRFLTDHHQHRHRVTFVYEANRGLRLKTRIETTEIVGSQGISAEEGIMLFQDIRFVSKIGLTFEARLVFFQTDSYSSRIYEFENDVRGVFSVPALFGTGKRLYLLFRYEIVSGTVVSVKFSETQKEGVRTLGSGPGGIEGDTENRITLQLDVRL